MAEEKKVEVPPQAPAKVEPDPKVEEKKIEEAPKPFGLDGLTKVQLQELYKKTPQLFEEAGIVPKKEEKPEEKKVEEPPKPQSAAPVVYEGTEIKLPTDVPVNAEVVKEYLAHAKEQGHTAKQVQGTIDFQTKQARDAIKREQDRVAKQPTPVEIDAANVATLKADKEFGPKYDENMELARRAALKRGDNDLLERLRTSDPVLVKFLWKIGRDDAEDSTRGPPNRNGEESKDEKQTEIEQNKRRYPNSPTLFQESVKG